MTSKIYLIEAVEVIEINKMVCLDSGNRFQCLEESIVEDALDSTFYPGAYPLHHGDIAQIAGALSFFLTQANAFHDGNKRTALITSLAFLNLNGWDLEYRHEEGPSKLSQIIHSVSKGKMPLEKLKTWYDTRKVRLKN